MSMTCGSLHYIAPEVLAQSYTEKADMWSTGVIVYMLLTGSPPFYGSDHECLNQIKTGKIASSSRWRDVSPHARSFVEALIKVDPENRLGAAEALGHRWICERERPLTATLDTAVLKSLRRYEHASHFRRACLSMMAWSLTLEDQRELREHFQELDWNRTGTISLREFADVLQRSFSVDTAEAEKLFRNLDTAGNDKICYSEFLAAALQDRVRMHEDVLHATFAHFDIDNTGTITVENLRALLGDSFEGWSVEELIRDADADRDGGISYKEFIDYLQRSDDDDLPVGDGQKGDEDEEKEEEEGEETVTKGEEKAGADAPPLPPAPPSPPQRAASGRRRASNEAVGCLIDAAISQGSHGARADACPPTPLAALASPALTRSGGGGCGDCSVGSSSATTASSGGRTRGHRRTALPSPPLTPQQTVQASLVALAPGYETSPPGAAPRWRACLPSRGVCCWRRPSPPALRCSSPPQVLPDRRRRPGPPPPPPPPR